MVESRRQNNRSARRVSSCRLFRGKLLAAVLTLGFGGGVVKSAAQVPASLTLVQAEQLAVARNADLRAAEAGVQAALAQLGIAREFPNPSLALGVSHINTDGSGNGTAAGNGFFDRSYDSIATLSQLFELGGKRGLRRESALAGRGLAEAQRDEVRRLLLQAVTQAYIAALEAREEVKVLDESSASLRKEADVAATRLKAGDISATDKAQIEIAAARFALDAEAARQTAFAAGVALEILLGHPAPEGHTELIDTLASVAPAGADDLLERPPEGVRPDIASAEAGVTKAEADFKLQQRGRVPDLTVSALVERNPPDLPNSAGVGVSFPLPIWNHNTGAIHAARAARDLAEAQLEKVRQQAAAEIATARSAWEHEQKRSRVFSAELLPKSADVLRSVRFVYEKGGATLLDLLSAQRNDNDLRVAAVRAQADYAGARVALAAALNRLGAAGTP